MLTTTELISLCVEVTVVVIVVKHYQVKIDLFFAVSEKFLEIRYVFEAVFVDFLTCFLLVTDKCQHLPSWHDEQPWW